MENRTKITLPSVAELAEIEQELNRRGYPAPELPDFAIANGAQAQRVTLANGEHYFTGKIWTRDLSQTDPCQVVTREFARKQNTDAAVESYDIGVMPRFQNPDAMGVGLAAFQGESVLAFKDKIAAYPHENASAAMDHLLWIRCRHVGAYKTYNHTTWGDRVQNNHAFTFMDKVYALHNAQPYDKAVELTHGEQCQPWQDYAYECRPVRAMRCADGSIQCLDILPPYRFADPEKFNDKFNSRRLEPGQELDTDLFAIGQYLNRDVMPDLHRSTAFSDLKATQKLTHPKAVFGAASFMHQIKKQMKMPQVSDDEALRLYLNNPEMGL